MAVRSSAAGSGGYCALVNKVAPFGSVSSTRSPLISASFSGPLPSTVRGEVQMQVRHRTTEHVDVYPLGAAGLLDRRRAAGQDGAESGRLGTVQLMDVAHVPDRLEIAETGDLAFDGGGQAPEVVSTRPPRASARRSPARYRDTSRSRPCADVINRSPLPLFCSRRAEKSATAGANVIDWRRERRLRPHRQRRLARRPSRARADRRRAVVLDGAPAARPIRSATCRAPSGWTSTATCPIPAHPLRGATRCRRRSGSPRRWPGSASPQAPEWWPTTTPVARPRHGSGGCCMCSVNRLPCSTGASPPGPATWLPTSRPMPRSSAPPSRGRPAASAPPTSSATRPCSTPVPRFAGRRVTLRSIRGPGTSRVRPVRRADNLGPDGRLRSPDQLRAEYPGGWPDSRLLRLRRDGVPGPVSPGGCRDH